MINSYIEGIDVQKKKKEKNNVEFDIIPYLLS